MIKGVFFDVGGTLYSYRNMPTAMTQTVRQLAERLALEHDIGELMRHYQAANKDADRQFAERSAYLFRDYFAAIFENFLTRLERTHLVSHFEWFEPLQREQLIDCLVLQEDCQATLAQLKDMGLYLSAVSNADNNQLEPMVERGELHRWLDHWTSSETAASCKPDARFFALALQKSGLAPQEVLFVGDSLEQDITGARAAGMKTALITEFDAHAPMTIGREVPDPDYRIRRLAELPAIVAALRG